jgi:membrane protein implicated in regulation of membrane protease activity
MLHTSGCREEERRVKAETESSSAPSPEEPPKTSWISQWVGAIAAVALIVGIIGVILFYGYLARPGWVGVADKKFWDYLELLIVPAALAIGVYLLNRAQSEREREAEEAQQERERVADEARMERQRKAEAAQRERELEVENQRAQDAAIQAYLDQIGNLLLDEHRPLRQSEQRDEVRTLARARTLTMLRRLDGERKGTVLQFLYEAGLINTDRIVDLTGADLRGADLYGADLRMANLSDAHLRLADLHSAVLSNANLRGATDLEHAGQGVIQETRGLERHQRRDEGVGVEVSHHKRRAEEGEHEADHTKLLGSLRLTDGKADQAP